MIEITYILLLVAAVLTFAVVSWTISTVAYEHGRLKEQVKQQEEEIKRLKIARNIAMRDRD